jgi:hypothetical protein
MNLFKKIWNKNFLKGKEPIDKFSEDIGGLAGEFKWIKYRNGVPIDSFSFHNEITNLSKSTVIRLLGQGTSAWRGTIDPTQYKISRMRFGNAPYTHNSFAYNTDLNLYYYDLTESVFRPNLTASSSYSSAGGRYTLGTPEAPTGASGPILSDSASSVVKTINRTTEYTNWVNGKIVPISITEDNFDTGVSFDQQRPPSHKTLLVEFLNSSGNVIASLNFNTVYSRDTTGNFPIVNSGNDNYLNNTSTNHKLYYSYPTGTETQGSWILQFMLGSGSVNNIINIRISFKVGYYNMVNSVVPKTGYNFGTGVAAARFPLSSGIDYYSTVSPVYNNSTVSSFIDDYSVTFSITMAQNEGNGSANLLVYYTEAFLFNSRDDLFSIIRFPFPSESTPKGFEKNTSSSYLISWTIKSIL